MVFNKLSMALAAALFLSLSVNFFMAGLMLGNAVSPQPVTAEEQKMQMSPDEARRAEWQKRDEALRAALSPADREVVQTHTEANKQTFEELKAKLDDARQNVAAAMTAEPFEQGALDAAIEAETEIKTLFMREMYSARRAVTEDLSPEGRKIFQDMNPLRRRSSHRTPSAADAAPYDGHDGQPSPRMRGRDEPDDPKRARFKERRERMEHMRDLRRAPPPPGSARPEDTAPPTVTDTPDSPPPAAYSVASSP